MSCQTEQLKVEITSAVHGPFGPNNSVRSSVDGKGSTGSRFLSFITSKSKSSRDIQSIISSKMGKENELVLFGDKALVIVAIDAIDLADSIQVVGCIRLDS